MDDDLVDVGRNLSVIGEELCITTMRGAPAHVQEWWANTGLKPAICRLVENGETWEEAHERLKTTYQAWFKRGQRGMNPLLRLSNRVVRERVLARVEAGEKASYMNMDGVMYVSVDGSSYVRLRPASS